MSWASGGASAGLVGHRDRLPVVGHDRVLAARHREGGQRLGLGHQHLVARPGGNRQRAARAAVEVERALRRARRRRRDLLLDRLQRRPPPRRLSSSSGSISSSATASDDLVGVLARPQRRDRDQLAVERAQLGQRHLARLHLEHLVHALGGGGVVLAQRLLEALSGARSSNSRNVSRRRERSGSRAITCAKSTSTSTSRTAVASCLEMRAFSACSVRFCLRLAPEIESMLASTPSRSPHSWSSCEAVLSPIPGTPGMLSEVSPLRPDEVGHQLGRDAVAVDHGLAVVDLRVGDAAAGGHDAHARLDQLEQVAVAGHHHHVDALPRAPGRRAWRSRRRPRSPAPSRSRSRTRRPAGACAATARRAGRAARGGRPCTPRRPRRGPTCRRPRPPASA